MSGQSNSPARLLQHRSSPVHFDSPVTPESIARAKAAAEHEREEIDRLTQLRNADKLELSAIVDRHGWQEVARWLAGLQAIHQDVRRI